MGAHLATKTVEAPVSSLHHRQNVKNLKYSTHKGDVFFDDDLSAIKENSNGFGNGNSIGDPDTVLHEEIMAHVKESFKDGNNFLKLHMFDRAKRVLQFAEGRYEHAKKLIEQAGEMRDCYIRCLKNGNPECSSPCDQPTDHPDKTHSKEPPAGETVTSTANTTKNTTTNTLGKHSIISPREIEACTYYPELKSLLSEDLKHSGSLVSLSIELSKDITFHRIPDCKRILQAKISEHGSVDAIIADLLNNLAACYEVMGDVGAAMNFYQESLKLRQLVFGSRSLKAADLMQNLATVLDGQGRLTEARDLLEEVLSIQEESHPGEVSMETAVTLNNLGVVNAHIGDLKKAQSYLQRTADARLRSYGKDHPFTQTAEKNLEYIANKQRCFHHEADRPRIGGDGSAFAVVEV